MDQTAVIKIDTFVNNKGFRSRKPLLSLAYYQRKSA
jgi:hypothetical protein